jgi:putative endonuclease
MHFVYILYSDKLARYYVGSTQSIEQRIKSHNKGRSKYTKKGIPWVLVMSFPCESATAAVQLEFKIKKRGIKRFLDALNDELI